MQHVLIVGAGIAGCSVALALARVGWSVTVIEKQARWAFQSSGIFVYGNGLAQFRELGVMDELVAAGFVVPDGRNVYLHADGERLTTTHYRSPAPGVPAILGIKRAEMHRVLAGRLAQAGIEVRLGTTVEAIEQQGSLAQVRLSDGRTQLFDLVVGADGIRSGVRALLWPGLQPVPTGFGVWRSVHRRPAALVDKIMMMGPGKRLGIMPISTDRLYLFGTIPERRGTRFDPAEWPRTMQARFEEFGGPARPFLDELASGGAEVLYTAVEEVFLPEPWHQGRVLLVGDAAHASTPFMGQGGAMAVQDAVVLGRLMAAGGSPDQALQAFSRLRAPMCRFVQEASRQVGQSGAQADAHERNLRLLVQDGQQAVDRFYAELARLESPAD